MAADSEISQLVMQVNRSPFNYDSEGKMSSNGGFGVSQNPRPHEDNGKNF